MKRKKVVAIGLLVTLLVFASSTRSIFTDVATSENNEISSGEFDIAISKDSNRFYNDLRLFEFSDIKPGDEMTLSFYVKNRGDIEISKLTMSLHIIDLEGGSMTPSERAVDNTTDVGELSKYLIVKELNVHLDSESWTIDLVKDKSLKELSGIKIDLLNNSLKEDQVLKITMTLEFQDTAGNECQTDRVIVNMKLNAEQ